MQTLLSILDWLVIILVVVSLARAVWNGSTRAALLGAVLTFGFLLFGLVSMCAGAGLQSGSAFNQTALFIALAAIAVVASRTWVDKPAQ